MNNTVDFEEIIHQSADKITVIKKLWDEENERFKVVKEINGMDRLTQLFFEREVNALKTLNNNVNIVKMYNFEIIDDESSGLRIGKIYLEYIDGSNLQETELSIIEFKDKYKIMLDIIGAIETSHSNGIIHRDIKPANIMLVNYQEVKLIDFGISKIKGMITGGTVGTVASLSTNKYTAPEVRYHSENSSFKSDIYSLGATLYYFLTGMEPPLPERFSEVLADTSGINPKLKELIGKCVKLNSDDRYETVTDLKRDFLLLSKELLRNSNFIIVVPNEIYLTAKGKKFISKHMSKEEFVDTQLDEWFRNPYAFIDSALKGSKQLKIDHDVFFFGGKYRLLCSYDDYNEYFIVRELSLIDAKVRNELTRTYMNIEGALHFYSSTNFKIENIENQTYELVSDLIDNRIEYESDKSKQSKFDVFFGAWTEYLETERKLIKETATKIIYKTCEYEKDDTIKLILDDDLDIDSLQLTEESVLSYDYELNNAKKIGTTYITVGSFIDIISEDDKNTLVLKRIKESTKRIPSNGGILVTDYKTSLYVIEKQLKALLKLRKNECECNENLRDLILGFDRPTSINGFENIKFINKRLDLNQKEAVKKALCTSSVCIIQGPPGTGKTSVIRETINQILKRQEEDFGLKKYRILIVSQSHAAVDHILEGLIEVENLDTKIIRIGNDSKILEDIYQKYSVDNVHNNWINSTQQKSNRRIEELLEGYKIDLDEFKNYMKLKVNQGIKLCTEEETNTITTFEEKYFSDKEKKRIINTAMVQAEWIRGLRLARDSEMRVIENSTIVAGTCTGFNSNPIVKNMSFDYVIVDEAAKASVPELLIPLLRGSRLVLVGDHNQLPPVLKDEVIKRCDGLDKKDLESGLFEHLFNNFPLANRIRLLIQYRMHETIGNMISKVFYGGEIETGIDKKDREHGFECFQDKQIVWVSTSKIPYNDRKEDDRKGKSFINRREIKVIKNILSMLDKDEKAKNYEIAVITGYSGQKNALFEEIRRMNLENKKIEVNTVDAYQGRDKDIVIFSTVRSNRDYNIGFQKSQKRINVAFSRAQRLIIIVGDHEHLYRNNHPDNKFPQIIDYIKENNGCSLEYVEVQNEGR